MMHVALHVNSAGTQVLTRGNKQRAMTAARERIAELRNRPAFLRGWWRVVVTHIEKNADVLREEFKGE